MWEYERAYGIAIPIFAAYLHFEAQADHNNITSPKVVKLLNFLKKTEIFQRICTMWCYVLEVMDIIWNALMNITQPVYLYTIYYFLPT